MPATAPLLTLSQVKTLDTAYLPDAADYWERTANLWEETFTAVHRRVSAPAGTPWQGLGRDAAQQRAYGDMVKVRAPADQLRHAAEIARRGGQALQFCKRAVLNAVRDASDDGFDVGEDYSLTDRFQGRSATNRIARETAAQQHASFIRHKVAALTAKDHEVATQIATTTDGLDRLAFDEPDNNIQLAGWDRPLSPWPPGPPRDDVVAEATDLAGNHVVLRRGYWNPPNDGFGWDKVSGKHGITNPNVFTDLISHSAPKMTDGNTLVYEVPIERTEARVHHLGPIQWTQYHRTGEIVTIKIVADVGQPRPDVYGGGQKGVITMYPLKGGSGVIDVAPGWTKVPGWVNTHFPVPDGA